MLIGLENNSMNDYFPGGFPMPGRSENSSEYRYGYNTQEKVDEIAGAGNHYTAKFWEYDPRVLHRWNIDPEFRSYPGESPYLINHGNPIWYSDPLGNDGLKRAQRYQKKHGGDLKNLGEGKFSVDKGVATDDGEFGVESKQFKDNVFEKLGKGISSAVRKGEGKFDNFMKDDPTRLGKIDTKEGSNFYGGAKIIATGIVSFPNGLWVLGGNAAYNYGLTNKIPTDLFNAEASSRIDVGFAVVSVIAPFNPTKAILGNNSSAEIIDETIEFASFLNDTGFFDEYKEQKSDTSKTK